MLWWWYSFKTLTMSHELGTQELNKKNTQGFQELK